MARIRSIKPDFFRHEQLFEAERATGLPLRVAYAGLWTAADRAGRFVWKPRALKLDVLPYDDVDFSAVLDALAAAAFIVKYEAGGALFGFIPSWSKHQRINLKEAASRLPPPPWEGEEDETQEPSPDAHDEDESAAVPSRDEAGESTCLHPPGPVTFRGEREREEEVEVEVEREGKRERDARVPRSPDTDAAPIVAKPLSKKPPRAQRWPKNAIVSDDWLREGEAARARHALPAIDLRLEAEKFANYWASRERDAARADWQRTWLNWVLQANAHGQGHGRNQRRSRGSQHPFGVFGALLEAERGGGVARPDEGAPGEG